MRTPDEEPGIQVLIFLVGVVIGAVVVGAFWWGLEARDHEVATGTDRQPLADASPPSAGVPSTNHQSSPTQDAAEARGARCAKLYTAQAEPLRAVNPAMHQWQVHIGAMNQLVNGEISLRQANRFWNRTRRGAQAALQKYAAARRAYEQRAVHCGSGASTGSAELRPCVRLIAARARTMHSAAVVLHTWQIHTEHMEMLRDGEMTAAQASRLWVKNWHRGNRQVRAYHDAHRDAHRAALAVASSPESKHSSGSPCAP